MTRVIQLPSLDVEQLGARHARAHSPVDIDGAAMMCTDAVHVVYTTLDETLAAVRIAAEFANALGVPVIVVHVRAVPYAVPVETPNGISPIETEGFVALLPDAVDVRLRVYLCRDERRTLPLVFKPHSLIMVAGRRRWWPTRAQRMRRMLEAVGHFVVFVDTSARRRDLLPDARRDSPAALVTKETSRA